jgi:radical SAM superfamily enzyme YgiQ (UPF0313 family)
MRVALVFPPQGHFTQPYLSLPSLAAFLRANGIDDVHTIDASIESYDFFLSRARLAKSLERVNAQANLEELELHGGLDFSGMERYQRLSEFALIGQDVVDNIEEAKRVLRSREDFYDYERYLWAGRTLEQGLRLFSAEYAPSRLTAHGFVTRYSVERSAEIVAALSDEKENPYIEFFREHTLAQLIALDPDLIGISVTFPSQAIPALTLCKLLKAWKPGVHITLGGGLLAYVAEKLSKQPAIWSLIDSFVMLEGEGPLLELAQGIERGDLDLARIGNLIYRNSAGEVVNTPRAQPLDIKTLPTPDFDGLPLDLYFTPELVLPLAATRGCYWGKCVFCTLYTVIGPGYRGRSVAQTVEDMQKLSVKYKTKYFYLAIEDLPPNMAKALPKAILDAKLDVAWWADARLEHETFDQEVCDALAASGCKRLAFGYESASRRVLDRMCKGIDPDASMDLVRRVRNAGISVTLYAMIGFPTETVAEARETLDTILAHRELIQEVSVRVFYLDESSEIYKRRKEFDILEVYPDPKSDLQVYYDFKPGSGMTRREARDVYLDFTRALRSHFPVFQNTNMLYHELKSHYFLYLAKQGSWEALRENVLEPSKPQMRARSLDQRPRAAQQVRRLELGFDRASIDQRLSTIDSATLRPRYQSDLVEDEDRARFDLELPREPKEASTLLYDLRTAEIHCVSPAAAALLERCDGTRTLEQVIEIVPFTVREEALRCVRELADHGWIAEESVR